MRKLLIPLFLLLSLNGFSQVIHHKIKVYLDCSNTWICDQEYIRSKINVVDFVRDRFDADVHVLVSAQSSSAGGIQATLNFIGQKKFAPFSDTLTYYNDPTATEDEQRKHMLQQLSLGLVYFISKTTEAGRVHISFDEAGKSKANTADTVDKWKNWVFQFGANGSLNGSQNYKEHYLNGYFSANKETELWKINLNVSANKNVQTFIDDSSRSTFTRKEYEASAEVARSINKHWSYGASAAFENSLYSNLSASYSFKPKLEYSLIPYAQFNTKRIVFQYMIGPDYNKYYDTTIYLKTYELQVQQDANLIASFTQPWGSINLGVFYSNYFDDFSKNSISFNGAISWRIVKGLNFALWGNYGLIHNQIGLRKGSATRDELLVKNRELRSTYKYNLGVGFSYRFGSILNNIVNPRFKGLNYSINL